MRRVSIILVAIGAACIANSAQAALSGFYDSAEKITTIISSPEVANAVRQAPIGNLVNSGTRSDGADEWTITVQDCDLIVFLKPTPAKGVGKTTYSVEIPGKCQ